jgi:hypothetical protein
MSPRTARPLLFATVALAVIGLFYWAPSPGPDLYGWRGSHAFGSMTLAERVRAEEARYTGILSQRQALIQKYGPKKENVHS